MVVQYRMSYQRALRTMPFTAVIMGRQQVNKTPLYCGRGGTVRWKGASNCTIYSSHNGASAG